MQIPKEKIAHMHGVAEFMYEHAEEYGLSHHNEYLYVLGLLHDIGYVSGKKAGHEEYGGNLIAELSGDNFFAEYITDHGLTPAEYMRKYHCNERGIPYIAILLWSADMSIDSKGENVGFDKRLEDIASRYGKDSEVYARCEETIQ